MRFASPVFLKALLEDCPEQWAELSIHGLADRHDVSSGDVVCCFNFQELESLQTLPVAPQMACIIGPILRDPNCGSVPYIGVKCPRLAFQKILQNIKEIQSRKNPFPRKIHPSVAIDPSVNIGSNVSIGAFTVIEAHVKIADHVTIGTHCVVESYAQIGAQVHCDHHVVVKTYCKIGDRTHIQSHTTIGSDGFGFERVGPSWLKIPHLSAVVIGSDCFIGSHVAIAAGALKPTKIDSCVIIDNHVQIAHHVEIGSGTAIAGCVGIAGSTIIGKNCLIGGGTNITGHIKITDGVAITGMTMVTKSLLNTGTYSSGMPVDTNENWKQKIITLNRLTKKEFTKKSKGL